MTDKQRSLGSGHIFLNYEKEIFVICHNIRSRHNVGSIFRTADGAGVSKIFCAESRLRRLIRI